MKAKDKRKLFTTIAAVFLFTLAITAAIISAFTLAPEIISYSVSTQEGITEKVIKSELCAFGSYSEINGDGPFEIRCEGENIYVFGEGVRLYRINAPIGRLTGTDVAKMKSGLSVQTLSELYELVQYLES